MKQITLILITVLFSCSGEKKETANVDYLYKLSIDEIIKYSNFYEQDSLLSIVGVTHFREAQPKETESWHFEYDENNRLIQERHFLYKKDSMELIYSKEFGDGTETELGLEEGDTIYMDQYTYNDVGNVIRLKTKYTSIDDREYFDYVYDDQNRLVQKKVIDYKNNNINNFQYKYELSKDTLIQSGFLNGDLFSVEKSITTKNLSGQTKEVFSYDLPEYTLYSYEKKFVMDDDYLQITRNQISIDSLWVDNGKKIRYVEHYPERMYTMHVYEYDYFGNLKKETIYSKLIKPQTEDALLHESNTQPNPIKD